ncbi:hypothetical protein B0H14DRAFT_2625353 [Mycena olivaceomarginata]|nr:hypothetical protein B0H14DRAFT_2625353 [Mycena olivaceomarginata]
MTAAARAGTHALTKTRRSPSTFPIPSKSIESKGTGPNPYSNMWRTICRTLVNQNRVLLNNPGKIPSWAYIGAEVFPAPITEFIPKGTPIDRSRQSEWANTWEEQMSRVTLVPSKSWIMCSCHRHPMAPLGGGIGRLLNGSASRKAGSKILDDTFQTSNLVGGGSGIGSGGSSSSNTGIPFPPPEAAGLSADEVVLAERR